MNRTRSISASRHAYARRRAVAASVALVLALSALYGLFICVCSLMLTLGLAA